MNVNKVPVLGLFESKQRLEVPLFQRQYVWELEKQWQPLWEDIERKFEEALGKGAASPIHFLGAMVLDQKQTPVTHVNVRQVIDGQQRLTTLQLFLASFRDCCSARGWDPLAKECAYFLFNTGMMVDRETDRFKVWPTQSDRRAFVDVLDAGSREEVERRHPLVRRKFARSNEPRHRIVEAYLFFRERLDDFFERQASQAPSSTGTFETETGAACFQTLKSSLMVVVIDLEADDDPQLIFETLNARGEPLLPADLLRNNIFMRARRENADIDQLYAKYWKKFDEDFWRQRVVQGRLERPRSDLYLQHFLSSRQGQDVRITQLYGSYKQWLVSNPFKSTEHELSTLSRQGDDFRRIIAPEAGDALCRLSEFISVFDVGTAYPLLLAMSEANVGDAEWRKIGIVLESYVLRRDFCGLPTAGYNRMFLQLMRNLKNDGFTSVAVRAALLKQDGTGFRWPDDAEFKKVWTELPIYRRRPAARIIHALHRINEVELGSQTEEITITSPMTIEHVMPVEWRTHWGLLNSSDQEFDLSHEETEAEDNSSFARRDNAVNTFGNLTIITQALNSSQSNRPWQEKKLQLLGKSLIPLNLYFADKADWAEDEITARGLELFKIAATVWPR